ncbi:MAG: hypothetical protein ABR500_12270 [Dermatophilaceae bacterium]|nr:hypothetical protein [Intrasporangiaceae bacterium]
MRKHVAAWPKRTWAVEGSNDARPPLAQRLLADGEHVVDVFATLSARARRFQAVNRLPRLDVDGPSLCRAGRGRTHALRLEAAAGLEGRT